MEGFTWNSVVNISTLIGLVVPAIWALIEYKRARKTKRIELFLEFREKFEKDDRMPKILFLLEDDSDKLKETQLADKYYYLGFLENLALMMYARQINRKIVFYMFGYSAIKCYDSVNFWTDGLDKDSKYWKVFCFFAKEMKRIESEGFSLEVHELEEF